MALSSVTIKLYDNTGVNLLYTFSYVNYINLPQTPKKHTVVEGKRGIGCIIVAGSTGSWDLIFEGTLVASNYEALVVLMDAMETAIALNTQYYLKMDKTDSTTYSYKVKRIIAIEYLPSRRVGTQKYRVTFKANAW